MTDVSESEEMRMFISNINLLNYKFMFYFHVNFNFKQ